MTMNHKEILERNGYCIIAPFLNQCQVTELLAMLQPLESASAGIRDVLRKTPALKEFVQSDAVRVLIHDLLGIPARMVRGIYFDKNRDTNWKVLWHQDRTIAVREKSETDGFDLWTVKDGIPHVRPPEEYIKRMLTLRVHLDECNEGNGALKVVPGSHHQPLPDSKVIELAKNSAVAVCDVPAGGVMAMKPLLAHSSSAGSNPSHRRVLHLEFSPDALPDGLEWYEAA
jgi:hypothetical protein